MRLFLAFIALWIGLVLEATVFQIPPMNAIHPGFVLVLLVLLALIRGTSVAIVFGVFIGLIQDICYGSFIGLNAFSYGIVAYFAGAVFSQFMNRNVAITFLTTLALTFLNTWLTFGLTRLFDVTADRSTYVLSQSFIVMMMNGVLVLILYPFFNKLLIPSRKNRYGLTERDA